MQQSDQPRAVVAHPKGPLQEGPDLPDVARATGVDPLAQRFSRGGRCCPRGQRSSAPRRRLARRPDTNREPCHRPAATRSQLQSWSRRTMAFARGPRDAPQGHLAQAWSGLAGRQSKEIRRESHPKTNPMRQERRGVSLGFSVSRSTTAPAGTREPFAPAHSLARIRLLLTDTVLL